MKKLDKSIREIWEDKYVVPLYQRNFRKAPDSNYYIGSLIVLRRQDGTLEVIDGQQRLTVLHMLCRVLGLLNTPHLTYDSRPEVERFFEDLFSLNEDVDLSKKDKTKVYRLIDGFDALRYTHIHTAPGRPEDTEFSLCKKPENNQQSNQCLSDAEKNRFT